MQRRQNFSRKRKAILDVVMNTDTHPTAEWIYQQLKLEYADLSMGTVYRNLSRFKEEGKIVSVGVVNGQERFDAIVDPHEHFICEQCGAVKDLKYQILPDSVDQQMSRSCGMQVHSHSLVFYGVCPDCMKTQSEAR